MMKSLFTFIFVFVLGASLCVPGGAARAGVFNPETFTLDNGMEVVVLPNHRAPVVLHMMWYKAGSADEPAGKSGVAHLLEHLMFKGTPNNPDGAFSRILAQHGGQENAFTTYDYTGYHQTVAKDRLDMVMALEADRMTNLVLDPADVATERDVVLEERNQRIENNPGARLRVEAAKTLYPEATLTDGPSLVGAKSWRRLAVTTCWRFTAITTPPITPSWWSRATWTWPKSNAWPRPITARSPRETSKQGPA